MAERIALVARELNRVESAGQARAAIWSALAELDAGDAMAEHLSMFTSPDPDQAHQEIGILRGGLNGELGVIAPIGDDQHVDAQSWERARRQVERAYVEVSGIEGNFDAGRSVDVVDILSDAIANAPRVFGEGVGTVISGVGQVAGGGLGGLLGGLGVFGVLVLVIVAVVVLRGRFA
jgi:hypothetical protein